LRELSEPKYLPQNLVEKLSQAWSVPLGVSPYPEIGVETYAFGLFRNTYRGHATIDHTGSVPGQISVTARVPDMGLALAVMINDYVYGVELQEIIRNRILDYWMGSDPVDWETRLFRQTFKKRALSMPPKTPRPAPVRIAGKYHDAGYGTFDVFKVEVGRESVAKVSHILGKQVQSHLLSINQPINLSAPIYVAEINKTFTSHLIFTHFDGPIFNFTSLLYKPKPADGVAKNKAEELLVHFGTVGSTVFFGGFWGKGEMVQAVELSENAVEDRSEVWFAKQ